MYYAPQFDLLFLVCFFSLCGYRLVLHLFFPVLVNTSSLYPFDTSQHIAYQIMTFLLHTSARLNRDSIITNVFVSSTGLLVKVLHFKTLDEEGIPLYTSSSSKFARSHLLGKKSGLLEIHRCQGEVVSISQSGVRQRWVIPAFPHRQIKAGKGV